MKRILLFLTIIAAMVPSACASTETAAVGNIDTLSVDTKMGRPVNAIVVRPNYYTEKKQYQVLYLLHGMTGNYTDWSSHMDLVPLATKYNVIIVCPDGQDSFYYDSPIDPKMQFESYIINELIPAVDKRYSTIAERKGRVITGLSMGGHGAMWLALRHQDIFRAAGSMSGALNVAAIPQSKEIQRVIGSHDNWTQYSAISLIPTLKEGTLDIIIDEGISDFLYDQNMEFHKALRKAGISHTFHMRPGKHTWDFWTESLPRHMKFFFE